DIAAEFAIDVRPLHGLPAKPGMSLTSRLTRCPSGKIAVMCVGTASPTRAVSSGSSATAIFCMKADARFFQLRRCIAVIGDVAVEHGARGDVGHGVVGGVSRLGCPLLARLRSSRYPGHVTSLW